ncbi:uncharacterized protein EV420DRAFT_1486409 [Desarmillaria tabescens]|uniref:Uncharacterized protein n=1 Tax=Armillaria tabescens TaxID=1929756 RepID=A0AA39JAM2_ARMTA|nr:uncharacterized protein EV420DRAFT_1486409 [Desarmillaria tabescens]KAK0439270.1 hypothetical protein EV420DRAFT_1486409 [Desarmillaria tabescens]
MISGDENAEGPSERPLKKLKMKPEMQANDQEYKVTDSIVVGVIVWTTLSVLFICKMKKSRCSFNKMGESVAAESKDVLDLLQKLYMKMEDFEEKLKHVEGKMDTLKSWIDDFVDNFHSRNAMEYLEIFIYKGFKEE